MIRPGLALALALASAAPAPAGPVALVEAVPDGAAVLDIREDALCDTAALDGARCLPAEWVLAGDGGAPIGFHALRWLLGTLGLSGDEPLVVHAGPAAEAEGLAVAAMIHLAGQASVALLLGGSDGTARGDSRSFSRETVFAAPMRLGAMAVAPDPPADLAAQLAGYAKTGAPVVFAPNEGQS